MLCVCVLTHVIAGRSGRVSESQADCQRVGQTVRESGRLSELGQTVREKGRLSDSRADCQRVGKPFFSVVTTTFLVLKSSRLLT